MHRSFVSQKQHGKCQGKRGLFLRIQKKIAIKLLQCGMKERPLAIPVRIISYIARMPAGPLSKEAKDSWLIHGDCKSCVTTWKMPISICYKGTRKTRVNF